jgi:hypothetical protein
MNDLSCPRCGAPVKDVTAATCDHCNAALPRLAVPSAPGLEPERFANAARSARFAQLQAFTPSSTGTTAGFIVGLVFLALFTTVAAGMTVPFLIMGPFALIPAFMAVLGVVGFFWLLHRWRRFAAAPLERHLRVVRDERVQVSDLGTGNDRRVRQQNYVLLEGPEGQRTEYECSAALAGAVARGDIGVAFVRDEVLLAFETIRA